MNNPKIHRPLIVRSHSDPRLVPLLALGLASALTGAGTPARAQDAEFVGILKAQSFQQFGAAPPTLELLRFETFVQPTAAGTVESATLELPNGASLPLIQDGDEFNFEQTVGTRSRLNERFPDGDHALSIITLNDGIQNLSLNLAGDLYPTVPRINNLAAAQAIDPGAGFTVSWDPFANAAPADFLIFEISDDFGSGNTLFETEFLPASTTSLSLSSGLLDPGRQYIGSLIFVKVIDFDTTYTTALAGYVNSTRFLLQTTDDSDGTAPFLRSERPFDGETDVPVNSVVAFEFNEPMDTSVDVSDSIAWNNLNGGGFTYRWSHDSRSLFCVYNATLPTGTTLAWTLNPSTGPQNLRDAAGNRLPSDRSGSFVTADDDPTPVPDLFEFSLAKGREYGQEDGSGSLPTGTHFAIAEADLSAFNTLLALEIVPPGGGDAILIDGAFPDIYLDEDRRYGSLTDLDFFFPDGDYELRLTTAHDGDRTVTLTLDGAGYPGAPSIVNFDAAQALDPAAPFTLQWTPFEGGTADDLIFLSITDRFDDDVFESPDLGEPGALDPATSTSIVIPAGTFASGSTYRCALEFARLSESDDTTYPGVLALAGYVTVLRFEVTTTGPPPPAQLELLSSDGFSTTELFVNGPPGNAYLIEATTDVAGEAWRAVGAVAPPGDGPEYFAHVPANFAPQLFYRARTIDLTDGVLVQGMLASATDFTPVAGALISASIDGQTAVSDANGIFAFAPLATSGFDGVPFTLTIAAPGYQLYQSTQVWADFPQFGTLQLDPAP